MRRLMTRLSNKKIQAIQSDVLDWYAGNKRDLPWRRTQDPYQILVSEVMLQQTQVSRVVPKYEAFLQEFPTVQRLAIASPAAVIRAWKGLGYNRRALNLQKAAQVVIANHAGEFPADPAVLRQLPGLGRYTAGAVATFAFGAVVPAVDTNVRQFIDTLIPERKQRTESDYEAIATKLIPADRPREWLHAVMDYTSLVLRPAGSRPKRRKPDNEPFVGSNRYLRGRTIDCLRDGRTTAEALYRTVAQPVAVSNQRYGEILIALEQEGLLSHRSGYYQLIGD